MSGHSGKNYTGAATADVVARGGTGVLHTIVFNTPAATSSIKLFDGVDATGTVIATITIGATAPTTPFYLLYNRIFNAGLTVTTTGASDITVTWR